MKALHRIPGTDRQAVTATDGTKLQRAYIYLEPHLWDKLYAAARSSNTSVSVLISAFASSGAVTSKKEKYDCTDTRCA